MKAAARAAALKPAKQRKARRAAGRELRTTVFIRMVKDVASMADNCYALVLEAPDSERTHAFSISLRRLLAMDWLARRLYRVKLFPRRESGIQALRKSLGRLRDNEVMRPKLRTLPAGNLCAEQFARHIKAAYTGHRHDFCTTAAATHWQAVRHLCNGKKVAVRFAGQEPPVMGWVRRQLLARMLEHEQGALDKHSNEELHEFRIRLKHYRYTLELLPGKYSGASKDYLRSLKKLQDALGVAHDWTVFFEAFEDFREGRRLSGSAACRAAIQRGVDNKHRKARHQLALALPVIRQFETDALRFDPDLHQRSQNSRTAATVAAGCSI